jgi:hypothetical protein
MKWQILALCLAAAPVATWAQDVGSGEVIVTGSRIQQDGYARDMPAVGLRRTADFLIQEVTVRGDSRDAAQRRDEIYAMIANALRLADKQGVQLAFGDFVVQPLTIANYKNLTLIADPRRPDTQSTTFLVKTSLSNGQAANAAEKRIADFIEAVPEVGRAQMDKNGEVTFSVVAPDSYRDAIASLIAADAKRMADKMGDGYAVNVEGLNMPVQWSRSGLTEVFLYIPYKLVVVPKP